MGENQEQRTHAKDGDNEGNSPQHRRSRVTGVDGGLLVEIWVGFFIVLASALALFLSVDLLILLARDLLYVWLYLRALENY